MNLTKRTNSLDFLHPLMRIAATSVIADLDEIDISFKIFETYRTPERQSHLKAKRPKVSNAGPWQSMHQYGLAVDFVIDVKGVNPWSTKGDHRQWWDALHLAGKQAGLTPLYNRRGRLMELPHMQLNGGWSWRGMKSGRYPPGGDDPWVWNLHQAALRYPKGAPSVLPDYLEDELECRPPL